MNIGPILQRELRRQARQWPTYWLRVLGGALVLAACLWGFATTNALLRQLPAFAGLSGPAGGRGLFTGLNKLMACLVWLIGPLLTADCLSREKREGTLGLLFLTPLRAADVVVGKAISHALRALMVLLAAYPILMLPVLLGGVTWADGARMFLLQLAVLGLALAAGLTASALSREWLRTRLLAFLLTLGASMAFVFIYVGLWTAWYALDSTSGRQLPGPGSATLRALEHTDTIWGSFVWSLRVWVLQNLNQLLTPTGLWYGGGIPGSLVAILQALAALLLCWFLVWCAVRFAAVGLAKTWSLETSPPPPGRMRRAAAALTQPQFGQDWHRRRRTVLLNRSPVAWLHGGTWSARTGRYLWGALAAVVLVIAWEAYPDSRSVASALRFALVPIVIAVAFSASASLRKERETGALELLLVTPLTPRDILLGRLRGLWGTFGVALGLLTVALIIGLAGDFSRNDNRDITGSSLLFQIAALWTAPLGVAVLGLGFGLRWTGFLAAWYRALAAWYLIPYAAGFSLFALTSLSDAFLDTRFSSWEAFSTWGRGGDRSKGYYPTLIGFMVSDWWWPFMGLVTMVRLTFLWVAWRLGIRALAERLFLPQPKNIGLETA